MTNPSFIENAAPTLVKGIEPKLFPLITQSVEKAVDKAMQSALNKLDAQSKIIETLTGAITNKIRIIDDLQEKNETL